MLTLVTPLDERGAGSTRYTPYVDPAQMATIAASGEQATSLRELGLAITAVALCYSRRRLP